MLRFKVIFLTFFFLGASMAFAYEEVKNLTLSAEGIERLEIDCGGGFLKVYGQEGLANIEVEAEIVVKGKSERSAIKFIRDKLELSLERRGSRAILISKFKHDFSILSLGSKHVNLTVNMPEGMDLKVDDGSGDISVEGIAGTVNIEDGSGSIKMKSIMGSVIIDDGSGDIRAEGIEGDVDIDDNSGSIDVKDVSGSVSIDDGSGSLHIWNVGKDVTLSDGSGSIHIDGVEGDVTIEDDGSGDVNIKNVKGKVKR